MSQLHALSQVLQRFIIEDATSRVLASGFPQEAKRFLRCASDVFALAALLSAVWPPLQNCNQIEISRTPLASNCSAQFHLHSRPGL